MARPLGALALLCGGALSLALLGALMTRQLRHFYLVWNLLLALIPLGAAFGVRGFAAQNRPLSAALMAIPWLLFLPNSPYLLTDFVHLIETPPTWIWGHLLALVWFSFTALLSGLFSLRLVHGTVAARWGNLAGWLFAGSASLLAGIGVALGRFQRWNSWDAVRDPLSIAFDVLRHLPLDGPYSVESLFPCAFGTFFGAAYVVIWTLTPDLPFRRN